MTLLESTLDERRLKERLKSKLTTHASQENEQTNNDSDGNLTK